WPCRPRSCSGFLSTKRAVSRWRPPRTKMRSANCAADRPNPWPLPDTGRGTGQRERAAPCDAALSADVGVRPVWRSIGGLVAPAPTATAATAASSTTATAPIPAATTTAAGATLRARARLVDLDAPALQVGVIEGRDRLGRLVRIGHLDESEAARLARELVRHDDGAFDLAGLRKQRLQVFLRDRIGKIAYVQLGGHFEPSF